jgi:hypothetical protein
MTYRADALSEDLQRIVAKSQVINAWKNSVRPGLRDQILPDLHDHLDFHRNIDGIASRISVDVSSGRYRPATPEFVTQEKKDGVARRMAVPDPIDALVLQCIVDKLEPQLKGVQPTNRAYYSRRHKSNDMDRIDGTFAYPWWLLWPEFQREIWEFTETHDYVVVMDLANYFDTIPLGALRNTIASMTTVSENVLNLLFFLLEALTWRPYFMPHSGVGLPQINFDAPRLLSHAYLFNIDKELLHLVRNSFVRWMDDVDAGVSSREEGKSLLKSIQNVLNSQGLQLNSNKSRILSAKDAVAHFRIQDNRALTIIEHSIKHGASTSRTLIAQRTALRNSYRKFQSKARTGQWEKVQKRYLGLFGKLMDTWLVRDLPDLLRDHSGLRGAVFRYLVCLGYSKQRLEIIEDFLTSGHCSDDASLFESIECLLKWSLPLRSHAIDRIVTLAKKISGKPSENPAFPFGAALILLTKYAQEDTLSKFILQQRSIWERSVWASRQVAAVTPRLPDSRRLEILEILQNSGLLQGIQVYGNLNRIGKLAKLDQQLLSYIMHAPSPRGAYPLNKSLIARTILLGEIDAAQKIKIVKWFDENVSDKHLLRLLNDIRR